MANPRKRRMRTFLRNINAGNNMSEEIMNLGESLLGNLRAKTNEEVKREKENLEAEKGIEFEIKVGKDEPTPKVDEKLLEEILPNKSEKTNPEPSFKKVAKKKVVKTPLKKKITVSKVDSEGRAKTRKELRAEIMAQRKAQKEEELKLYEEEDNEK